MGNEGIRHMKISSKDHEARNFGVSRRVFCIGSAAAATLVAAGCGLGGGATNKVTIAYQPNLGYAPIIILKNKNWLSDLSDHEVNFTVTDSGALIRSGMLTGDIQFGALAISPFLVGLDRGVDWAVVCGLSEVDQWMMVSDPKLRTLADFGDNDKISVLSADNNQAAFLRIAAARDLGDGHALDSNLVYQPQSDGMQALLSGQVEGHFTNPPYQFLEKDAGMRVLLSSRSLYEGSAPPSFALLTALNSYGKSNPEIVEKVREGVGKAVEFLASNKEESVAILAKEFDSDPATFERYVYNESVNFTIEPAGIARMGADMQDAKMISSAPSKDGDVLL